MEEHPVRIERIMFKTEYTVTTTGRLPLTSDDLMNFAENLPTATEVKSTTDDDMWTLSAYWYETSSSETEGPDTNE